MADQPCTAPSNHCPNCRPLFKKAFSRDEYSTSDLLYRPNTHPVIFCHKVSEIVHHEAGDRLKVRMEAWLQYYFKEPVPVYTEMLAQTAQDSPDKGTGFFCLVDLPRQVDPRFLIEKGLFPKTKVAHEEWQIEGVKEGECPSAFRLEIFTAFKDSTTVKELEENYIHVGCSIL
ncbi:hypothetical protein BJX70DRAFT_395353 [Aspergillus crustosus]